MLYLGLIYRMFTNSPLYLPLVVIWFQFFPFFPLVLKSQCVFSFSHIEHSFSSQFFCKLSIYDAHFGGVFISLLFDLLLRAPASEGTSNFCAIECFGHFSVLPVSFTPREVIYNALVCIQWLVLNLSVLDQLWSQALREDPAFGLETLLDDWLLLLVWLVSDDIHEVLRRLECVVLVQDLHVSRRFSSVFILRQAFNIKIGVANMPISRVLIIALAFLMFYLINDNARAVLRIVFITIISRI